MSMYSPLMDQLSCMKGEERSHNPKNLAYYMDAVMEGHAGMWRVDQQHGLGEGQETDEDQSLLSHSGPVDVEDLTMEDPT